MNRVVLPADKAPCFSLLISHKPEGMVKVDTVLLVKEIGIISLFPSSSEQILDRF